MSGPRTNGRRIDVVGTTTGAAGGGLGDRRRDAWATGPESALIGGLGPVIVKAAAVTAGQRVLDVAAGVGHAAVAAAAVGAQVVACDLVPGLLSAGRRRSGALGLDLEWLEADVEALPFADGDFDVVLSVVGAAYAPHHQQTADEIVRVCRSGGAVAMINWTGGGVAGQLSRMLARYAPAPSSGEAPSVPEPPTRWGDEPHVRRLFGDRISGLTVRRRRVPYPPFTDPTEFREFYKANDGPTIAAYCAVGGDPDRAAALDQDFLDVLARADHRAADAANPSWEAEYVIVTARRT